MARVSYVLVSASESGRLRIEVTQEPEVSMWLLRNAAPTSHEKHRMTKAVLIESFERMLEARSREDELTSLSKWRLRRLVRKSNPDFRDLLPEPVYHESRGFSLEDFRPDSEGGVAAYLKDVPPPRSPGFEQPWPMKWEDALEVHATSR